MCTTYNGWYNYETWLVNLWYDAAFTDEFEENAERGDYAGMSKEEVINQLADYIRDNVYDGCDEQMMSSNGFIADIVHGTLGSVDWREIGEHYYDDVKETITEENE